ncbi:sigma 54-interacting transcriptional regulator [Desulforhopalus singaporensis]|nr:sigma 54-interacting transcriptional regulator [Desulforhopalus singaporensis]
MESERMLKNFFDTLEDTVIIFDGSGQIVYANPFAQRMLAYPLSHIIGKHFRELYPENQVNIPEGGGSPVEVSLNLVKELPLITGNGDLIHVKTQISKILGAKNQQIFVSISKKISDSETIKRQLKLKERERKSLSSLINNLPSFVYSCKNNINYTMQIVSKGCLDLTGYRPDHFINDSLIPAFDIIYPEDRHAVRKSLDKKLANKESYSEKYRIVTRSGDVKRVWEQGSGVFAKDGNLIRLEGFITDISDQKPIEVQSDQNERLLITKVENHGKFCNIVGQSDVMHDLFDTIRNTGRTESNVVILGESGTGKELVAKAIHKMSKNHEKPFVPVNCSAIPEELIESEFFGYKKGAFSGANYNNPGYLDMADKGTLFLDEIGDISLNLQVKLLRAIEGSGFTPVGGRELRKPNFRVIAATNKDLVRLVREGKMREDFYYRINIIPIYIPPLRDRKEDIPLLVNHFLKQFTGKTASSVPQNIMDTFLGYEWPGNVRELQNVVQRYIATKHVDFLESGIEKVAPVQERQLVTIEQNKLDGTSLSCYLEEVEKKLLLKLLRENDWHRGKVAKLLNINYRTLQRKIKRYGIKCVQNQ